MEEALKGYSLLEWLLSGGLTFFLIKEVFWKKYQKNADTIETSIIDSVKESKSKLIQHDKELQAIEFRLKNIESDIGALKEAWRENNNSLVILNDTIKKFDDSFKVYHRDNAQLMAEVKQTMDKSNMIHAELLGFLKAK